DGGPAGAAAVGASEQVILATERDGSDRALDWVVVEIDTSIVQKTAEGRPAGERIAYRLSEAAAAGDAAKLPLKPGLHRLDERPGLGMAHGPPLFSGTSSDGLLDRIKLADPAQSFGSDGRAGRLVQVVELPARVCPTGGQYDLAPRGQPLESGVTVNLQNAAESFEMRGWPLRLAVGAVKINGGRRIRPAPGPVVARIDPQSAHLGAAAAGIEQQVSRRPDRSTALARTACLGLRHGRCP